jgi:hypothetical protein
MKKANSQNEVFISAHRFNLSFIVNFHNEVKRNFQNEIAWMNRKLAEDDALSDQEINEFKAKRNVYVNTFEPYLMVNTFLMMVSHLEEWLFHVWKGNAPETELFENKGSIGRFKPVLQAIGVDLSHSKLWAFVKGCQDIRSCLLHANGRVSLNRKPERIHNFVAQHSELLKIESDRLVLTGAFLQSFQKAVEQLIHSASAHEIAR